jgi:hypothetical protein
MVVYYNNMFGLQYLYCELDVWVSSHCYVLSDRKYNNLLCYVKLLRCRERVRGKGEGEVQMNKRTGLWVHKRTR